MTQLADQISGALDVEMAAVYTELDDELAAQAISLHYTATAVPGSGEPDQRTTGMKRYAVVLSRDRIVTDEIEKTVVKMLGDSLDEKFLAWTGRFCAANPRISENDVAERLIMFSTFVAMRALCTGEDELDRLMAVEEVERVKFEEGVARYRDSVKRAKVKMTAIQADYEKAGRLRVRASGLASEINALTVTTPDDVREAVRAAHERHLRQAASPTRDTESKTVGDTEHDGECND